MVQSDPTYSTWSNMPRYGTKRFKMAFKRLKCFKMEEEKLSKMVQYGPNSSNIISQNSVH